VRILVMSFLFPPYNTMGAVRVGKMVKYLTQFGHDVRVITAREQTRPATLELEIPAKLITATPWFNVNRPVELALGGRKRIAAKGYAAGGGRAGVAGRLGFLYKTFLNYPDGQIGWRPYARRAATRLVREWRPDIIYASATPFTSLLVAHDAARRFSVPWVAELRDLWVMGNAYYPFGGWRRSIEERLEQRVLATTRGLVTISEPLAEALRTIHQKPTCVVLNGFDPQDYPAAGIPKAESPSSNASLRILYTGAISNYGQRRDPSPLFEALRSMGPEADRVRVVFCGWYLDTVKGIAARSGVQHLVEIHEPVSHREALRLQVSSDVLLLLLWDSPLERGVYTGKLFEYIGARRPILALGPDDNVAAQLITQRRIGVVLRKPPEIAAQLRRWLIEKDHSGAIAPVPPGAGSALTREDQARRLESFLLECGSRG